MKLLLCSFLLSVFAQLSAQQTNSYYPSGLVRFSYEIKNDKLNGNYVSYYENGLVKAKGSFMNGQKTGNWQAWDTSGMLRSKRNYRNNLDFELLSEWNSSGCSVSAFYLEKKKKDLQGVVSYHNANDYMYTQRYWEAMSPGQDNLELFSNDFTALLKTEIAAGRIIMFSDDRFINNKPAGEAAALVNRTPDEYMLKVNHDFYAVNQKMQIRVIGIGLVYKDASGEKIGWLYGPDLFTALEKLPVPAPAIAGKFRDHLFSAKLEMTTVQAPGYHLRKIDEKERMALVLAEVDFETHAWVYLLEKDPAANK
ncbi:MAG: hypothetical protein ABI688_06055 [Bacteroidota bacterium]